MHWHFLIVPMGTLRETLRVGNWLRLRSLSKKRLSLSILLFMFRILVKNYNSLIVHLLPESRCKYVFLTKLKYWKKFPAFSMSFTESSTSLQVSKKLTSPLEVLWKSFSLVFLAVSCFSLTVKLFVKNIWELCAYILSNNHLIVS